MNGYTLHALETMIFCVKELKGDAVDDVATYSLPNSSICVLVEWQDVQ